MNKEFRANLLQLKQLAFTLAETLIVMGIIGVVAALTLPNLNSSTGEKEKVAKLQKLYSNFNDAFGRAEAVYGPINTWSKDGNQTELFMNRLFEFIKVTKVCSMGDSSKACWPEDLSAHNDWGSFISADGSGIFVYTDFTCSQAVTVSGFKSCGSINVDIDGPLKGKNEKGVDIFYFAILQNQGIVPNHSREFNTVDWIDYPSSCFRTHTFCTAWVIENGNMDYLKADSTGKCNNSDVTLNETITSCK